jgi:hypothetical protein
MKVLMLDIDGVLNTLPHDKNFGDFDKHLVVNLEMLLGKVKDLKIVISSYWRHIGLEKLKETFKLNGIDPRRIYSVTGNEISDGHEREYQIAHWLSKHPDVTAFVIFDDNASDFIALKSKLVKTNPSVGLTQRNVEKAIEILEEK